MTPERLAEIRAAVAGDAAAPPGYDISPSDLAERADLLAMLDEVLDASGPSEGEQQIILAALAWFRTREPGQYDDLDEAEHLLMRVCSLAVLATAGGATRGEDTHDAQ